VTAPGSKGTDPHRLAGAFAMDALDERDRRRFERHLRRCDACEQEVRGLRETAARLAAAAAAPPPPELKASVIAAARQTRQHAPVVRVRRRLLLTIGTPLAAAAATVALLLGTGLFDHNEAPPSDPMLALVLTAADAQMMTGHVAGGGNASVVMSHQKAALVFSAAGLPRSGAYQVWLMGPAGHRLAGTIDVGQHGMLGPVVATGLRPGDHLMLMAEPSGTAVLDLRL
jgi:anti-sigma-K factor RskA